MTRQSITLEFAREEWVAAIATAGGIDRATLQQPGTTVVAEAARAGTGLASAYRVDRHLLIRADPAIVDECASLLDDGATHRLEAFEAALDDRWIHHGRGWVHLIGSGFFAVGEGDVRSVDRTDPGDRALIAALIAADPEGADSAELELEDLDANILGVERDGTLAAYASERPWDTDTRFADIGVVAHPAYRRQGLALRATHALCRSIFDEGRFPMYRCNDVNPASKALALRAGFVPVAELSAATLDRA